MASNKNSAIPIIDEKGPSFVVFDKTQNDITSNSNMSQLTANKQFHIGGRGMQSNI